MHSQITLRDYFYVPIPVIEILHRYVEIIKSIRVRLSGNLSDLISLDMAAVIWESEGYAFDAINHFIDGDIDRPNPFLASFKNIDWINMIEAPLEI